MRILQVVGGLNIGGVETWLVQLLRGLDREKYQVDVLVHTREPGAYDDDIKSLGVRIIPCLSPSNPLLYAYNLRRILRARGPYDCVHCHMHQFTGYVLFVAASMGVPMRLAHSRLDTRALDGQASFPRKAYIGLMDFLVRRYATGGFAITESAAASLFSESWKDDPRWAICPTGIDFGPFEEVVDPSVVRAELGIAQDAFVIGHVGRFFEQKNHRFIVEMAAHVVRQEPRATFLLVGDGPLRPEIEAAVRSSGLSGRFVFTGTRRDVPRLMKGAMDCFLFPSLYEGLGRVAWEAQAAGLPCLISEAVPDEGCITASLVRRLSLKSPASNWASALLEMRHMAQKDVPSFPQNDERASIASARRILEAKYDTLKETHQ